MKLFMILKKKKKKKKEIESYKYLKPFSVFTPSIITMVIKKIIQMNLFMM